ncbi:glycosyltransferase family 2 protein [Aurantiacibacter sp. MUD11]|uniref:glycosyltransferase family 2 protein n=1 Tax=Aurantiacibacter sp. MUD11 TaxID=3003265 RepID=UPI0022AB1D20|nr:glycosyltransferase family 2 protein [Aurantiacibacter sp. MUD11]WAT17035.1 glycosyltransferase family 2 protein [Aurantiacibacter sp. MUD11]
MTKSPTAQVGTPVVSIMIVAYQALDVISNCLTSIATSRTSAAYEVLMIDNGTDGTTDYVRNEFPDVQIIPSRGNIGFGAGNNAIAEHANGTYLLLLNPDTVVQPDAIDELLDFAAKHDEAIAWGGVINSPDGAPDVSNFLRLPSLTQLIYAALGVERLYSRMHHDLSNDPIIQREVLCGAFFLIKSTEYRRIGGFDESFFLYSEEMDFFARIAKEGGTVLATPNSKIIHLIGTSGTMSEERALYKAQGMMHFAHKHWSKPKIFLAAFLIWLAAFERAIIGLTQIDRSSRVAQMGRVSWALCWQPGAWMRGYSIRSQKGID